MKRKIFLLISAIALLSALCAVLIFSPVTWVKKPGGRRTVTALDGSRMDIPDYPQRIACLYHPAYDKIVMLSKGSRIALLPREASPWAMKFYPELKNLPRNQANQLPDVERLLKLKVDLVIYPKGRYSMENVVQAGSRSSALQRPVFPFKHRGVHRGVQQAGHVLQPGAGA